MADELLAPSGVTVTVTQLDPFLVRADGATTACPAARESGLSLAVGDRVQATVRTPQRPLITGKVDTTT